MRTARETPLSSLAAALAGRGYSPLGASFTTMRPDRTALQLIGPEGERLVGKHYPDGAAAIVFENMTLLWESTFGRLQPPPLPRPVCHLPEIGFLIMEHVEGRPLVELADPASWTNEAIDLLVALHSSDATPSRRRTTKGIVRSLRRKQATLMAMGSDHTAAYSALVDALDAHRPGDRELVPSHGDFSHRNVIVSPSRLAIIDWDRFQLSDPARDVAYIGAWHWAWTLRQVGKPSWCVLEQALRTYDEWRPEARVPGRVQWHIAAALARISHGLVYLWPEHSHWVPRIIAEAFTKLENR